jgi:hypothetical protein
VALLLGALLSYLCIYCPVRAALNRQPEVMLHVKGVAACPLLLVLGLVLTVYGKRAGEALFRSPRELSGAGWFLVVALVGVGILVSVCLEAGLKGHGYVGNVR